MKSKLRRSQPLASVTSRPLERTRSPLAAAPDKASGGVVGQPPAQTVVRERGRLPGLFAIVLSIACAFCLGISAGFWVATSSGALPESDTPPRYVRLHPLDLPLIDEQGRMAGAIVLSIVLQVRGEDSVRRTEALAPRLRDRLLTEFNVNRFGPHGAPRTPAELKSARNKVTEIARAVIGRNHVTQALLVDVRTARL